MKFIITIAIISFSLLNANGYKILGVFPTAATSHYSIGFSLMKGLAEKGHDVTFIAPYKEKQHIPNLRTIHVPEGVTFMDGKLSTKSSSQRITFIFCRSQKRNIKDQR